jgi:hypothetical protein
VEVRPHDPEREVPLHAFIELGASEPSPQRLLSGDEESAPNECADGRP